LASILGKSLKEIDEMEASEVMEWQYWLAIEPRHEKRADYHAAQITHAVYSILQAFSKNTQKISLEDNLLKFTDSTPNTQDIEEQNKKNAQAIMAAFGKQFTGEMTKLAKDVKTAYSESNSESNKIQLQSNIDNIT